MDGDHKNISQDREDTAEWERDPDGEARCTDQVREVDECGGPMSEM